MATKSEAKTTHYKAGEALFTEGAIAHHVFIINAGHVQVRRTVFKEPVAIETLGRGDVCGDIAFADGATYPVSAIAVDEVEAVVVHRDDLSGLLANPNVVQRLVSRMAARITHAHFRIANLSLRELSGRVLLQLRFEAERNGGLEGDVYVQIPFDLPDVIGAERAQVDAILREIIAAGLIESDGAGRFRVPDLAAYDRRLTYLELHSRMGE